VQCSAVQGTKDITGEPVRELQFSRCELMLLEAGSRGKGIVREHRVRGTSAVGTVTRQRLVTTQQTEKT
jgi:hypothetical protein